MEKEKGEILEEVVFLWRRKEKRSKEEREERIDQKKGDLGDQLKREKEH